jgi:hypothetical protein
MGGASAVVPIVVIFRARTGAWCSALACSQSAAAFGPHRIQYELQLMVRSSRKDETRSSGQSGSDRRDMSA